MKDYFEDLSNSNIIKNEEFLLPSHLPDEILFRDKELGAIANAIKPFLKKRSARNVFVHGPAGVGKTTAIKYLYKQAQNRINSVKFVYTNCWETYTVMSILNKVTESLKLPLPRRGLATDEIFDRVISYLRNYGMRVVLFLDDVDGLQQHNLFNILLKANEAQSIFLIVAISQKNSWLAELDERIRQLFSPIEVPFVNYSEDQIYEILKVRAEGALFPDSYDERLLRKIAHNSKGIARLAIEALRSAAKLAEERNHLKITIQDYEDARFSTVDVYLSPEEKEILELLGDGELSSSDLFNLFTNKYPKTRRQFRNYILTLEKKGVIVSTVTKPKLIKRVK